MNLDPVARAAQRAAELLADLAEDESLPVPPRGFPALMSIPGDGIDGATVLGYFVATRVVHDVFGPDGRMRVPGDDGYLDVQYARLGVQPMPAGWRIESRDARILFAIVRGNPTLLEAQAKAKGYSRAIADGPNSLRLGEIA